VVTLLAMRSYAYRVLSEAYRTRPPTEVFEVAV